MVPELHVTLHPHWGAGTVDWLDVAMRVRGREFPAGEALCTLMESTVNIPFCPISGEIEFRDDDGALSVLAKQDPEDRSFVKSRSYVANRPVTGDLSYSYRILPREVPDDYTSSPYFDFRAEPGGANGAGITFLAMPAGEEVDVYDFSLEWEWSNMPGGSRGVWSLGSGNVQKAAKLSDIRFAYYAMGEMSSEEEGDFGLYWFGDAPFDMSAVASRTRQLFAYMSHFFGDDQAVFRIFARRDPFEKSGGGTAATRSFMFGYSEQTFSTVDEMQNLLAHEMVHNWPHMTDEPAGRTTWFNEGSAEYYSVVLPFRAGLSTLEDALAQIRVRSEKYYLNPTREMSNGELAKLYWTDRRTQRVPYGRGFFYIANMDAAVRRATDGARCIDDIILPITRLYRSGEEPGPESWLSLLSEVLGRDATPEYEAMVSGQLIVPDPDMLGGAFAAEPATITFSDTDETGDGYEWRLVESKRKETTCM